MSRSLPKILALGVVCGALILRPILASAETPLCELASPAEQALGRVLASPSDFSFEGTLLLERAEGREFLAVKWPEPAGGGSLRRMNKAADPVVHIIDCNKEYVGLLSSQTNSTNQRTANTHNKSIEHRITFLL